jgi:hypothetical protein
MKPFASSVECESRRGAMLPSPGEIMLVAALSYAKRGWSVFPARPRGKEPTTAHGVLDATRDETTIQGWWHAQPAAGVAIATGRASRLVVIDIDGATGEKSLERLQEEIGPLPVTAEVRTARGRHLYFALPERKAVRCSVGRLGTGLDVRGDGGYVVAPPSLHPTGSAYEWLRECPPAPLPIPLARLLDEHRSAPSNLPAGEKFREGTRNATLASLAGTMRRRGMGEDAIRAALLAENAAKCDPPLAGSEVERIAASISRYAPATPDRKAKPKDSGSAQWPEALAPEAFHGLAGEIVHAIEPHSEADPAALLLQFLAAFGSAVGSSSFFRVEGDLHRPNLFVCLVGVTSGGRKGTSLGRVRETLTQVDPEWAAKRIATGLSSGEGLIWSVRDAIEKSHPVRQKGHVVGYETVTEDPGIEDKRLLVVETEFAAPLHVMSREGNTLSAILRDAWDRGDLSSLTKNSPARATGAHVSIIGHITKDELLRCLSATEMANGFANRFLWVCVRRSKLLPEGGNFDLGEHPDLVRRLDHALKFGRTGGEMRRDDEAQEIWRTVYPELSEERPGLLGSIISRAPAQVLRLSVLYALLDESLFIRPAHLLAALAVWAYCEASAHFIFGDSLGYPEADRILSELRQNPEGLTRTEISGLFGRHRSEAEIDAALRAISERGLASRQSVQTPGRPVEIWKAT